MIDGRPASASFLKCAHKSIAPLPDFRKGGANVVYFSGCRKNNIVVNFSGQNYDNIMV